METPLGKKRKVLVIDDSMAQRVRIKQLLDGPNYEIHEANNGKEGLELIRKHHADTFVVFLDIYMPEMDGLDVAKIIKDEVDAGKLNEQNIVMLTKDENPDNVRLAKEAGIVSWITKPPGRDQLTRIFAKINQKKA